jgi:hypothetical protein
VNWMPGRPLGSTIICHLMQATCTSLEAMMFKGHLRMWW